MTVYRAYLLNEHGKIFHGEDVEALDNEAAVAAGWSLLGAHNAKQEDTAHGFEIWMRDEMIFSAGPGRFK